MTRIPWITRITRVSGIAMVTRRTGMTRDD